MTLVTSLESFVGVGGHTADEEFDSLILSLELNARFLEEEDEAGTHADLITVTYEDKKTGVQYELWYQVRTSESPEEMEFAYGFHRLN
jgi:hypothetical protein